MKRTYQPKKKKRMRLHGFRAKKINGSNVVNERRKKGRWILIPINSRKKCS